MHRISFALILVGTLGAGTATADTIAASGVATQTIDPSADAITLDPANNIYTITGIPTIVTLQTGTFLVGHSGSLDQDIPFTFQETVTTNGDSQIITITGDDFVRPCCDRLTFDQGPATLFPRANVWFTLQPRSFTIGNYGNNPFTLSAQVSPAPEPATLGLMGAALVGLACLRRKF